MILEFLASMGEGKSISMAYIGDVAREKGRVVHANFKLGDFSLPFDTIRDIKRVGSGLVLIDDIISWLDSRASMKNYKITWLYTESRKRGGEEGVDIVYSSQVDTGADYRLRYLTNAVMCPVNLGFPFFRLDFFSIEGRLLGSKTVRYGEDVTSLFNTYEVIEQKVYLSDLRKLFSGCVSKTVFTLIVGGRFNFTQELSRAVFDCLKVGEIFYLRELLELSGFELVGGVE